MNSDSYDQPERYSEPKVDEPPDPFEQLNVLITPEDLAKKARTKKKSSSPYIPATEYFSTQVDAIMRAAKSLRGEKKSCFKKFIQDYKQSLLVHCQEINLAEETEGGCEKMSNKYSIHTRVVEEALLSCGVNVFAKSK